MHFRLSWRPAPINCSRDHHFFTSSCLSYDLSACRLQRRPSWLRGSIEATRMVEEKNGSVCDRCDRGPPEQHGAAFVWIGIPRVCMYRKAYLPYYFTPASSHRLQGVLNMLLYTSVLIVPLAANMLWRLELFYISSDVRKTNFNAWTACVLSEFLDGADPYAECGRLPPSNVRFAPHILVYPCK